MYVRVWPSAVMSAQALRLSAFVSACVTKAGSGFFLSPLFPDICASGVHVPLMEIREVFSSHQVVRCAETERCSVVGGSLSYGLVTRQGRKLRET